MESNLKVKNKDNYLSMQAMVADALREKIITKKLRPGQKIIQQDIAAELGVSRVPVREALRSLEVERWVDFEQGKGFVVADPTIKDVYELYVIRMALESITAGEAARICDPQAIEEARLILEQTRNADNYTEWLELNKQFHTVIYKQTNMEHILDLIERYSAITSRWVYYYIKMDFEANRNTAFIQHKEILDAISNADCDKAQKLTMCHLAETRDNALRWLEMTGGL
jgi:DNA-binding GntR family transcriptional regulator